MSFELLALSCPCRAQGLNEEEEYSIACGLYDQGLYELATNRLQAFRNAYPSSQRSDSAEFLLGECAFYLSRFKEALAHYEGVRSREYDELITLRKGQVFFYQGEPDRAIAQFEKSIYDFPKGKWADSAIYYLGETYFRKSDFLSAIDVYNILIQEYPKSPYMDQCRYSIAYCYYKKGDAASALPHLEKVIKEFPGSQVRADAQVLMGQVLQGRGDNTGAAGAFRNALASMQKGESGADLVLYQLGTAYYGLGDWSGAETSYGLIVKNYPGSGLAVYAGKGIADCYFKMGDFVAAARSYKKLLLDYPSAEITPDIRYWAAMALAKAGNAAEAEQDFRGLIEEYRGKGISDGLVLDSWIQIGEMKYKKGDFQAARSAFGEAAQAPDRFGSIRRDAMIRIADCYVGEKKYEIAVEYYGKAAEDVRSETEQPQVKFQIAYAYYKQDDFKRAVPMFQDVLKKEKSIPADKKAELVPGTLYWLGWAFFKQGKFSQAADSFKKLVEGYPSNDLYPDALYRMADSLYNLGAYADARKAYESVVISGRLEPESLYAIACSYYLEGKSDSAVRTFRTVVEKYPESEMAVESAFKVAEFESQNGSIENAVSYFRFITANSGQSSLSARAQIGIGDTFFKGRKYAEALAAYAEAAKRYPSETRFVTEAEFKSAECYLQTGDPKKAREAYQSFLAKHPGSDLIPEANYRSGSIYFSESRFSEALPYFRKSAELSPRRSETGAASQIKIGDCLFNLGKYEDAVPEYLKVIVLYPGVAEYHPEAQYKIGVSLLMGGRNKDAKDAFQRVIDKYPNSKWAKTAKEESDKIQQ